jgi:hypothetical protein
MTTTPVKILPPERLAEIQTYARTITGLPHACLQDLLAEVQRLTALKHALVQRCEYLAENLRAANQLNQVTCPNCDTVQTHCNTCNNDLAG